MHVCCIFFSGLPNNTGLDITKIMAKVPCKEDVIFRNSSFRKAVSRYVRCYSQVSVNSHTEKRTFYRISDINVLCQIWVSLTPPPLFYGVLFTHYLDFA